jgi:hypothetical protein
MAHHCIRAVGEPAGSGEKNKSNYHHRLAGQL